MKNFLIISLITVLGFIKSISQNCTVEIEMVQGVECILPMIVSTGQIIFPCEYTNGSLPLPSQLGYRALIAFSDYQGSNCFSFCLQGQPVTITCSSEIINTPCDVEIVMVQGVECILPQMVSTGQILNPCQYINGAQSLPDQIGYKALIGYSPGSCFSICQQGQNVNIGCTAELVNTSCDIEVEIVQTISCGILPKIVNTGEFLDPFPGSVSVSYPVGTRLNIGYTINQFQTQDWCDGDQKGRLDVVITCVNEIPSDSDFTDCTSFEEYSAGNIIPQGSPKFTLFSNQASQNANVSNVRAYSGSKSLLIGNNTNVDYNISRTLTEDKVARLDWKVYIPSGKTGSWSLETNTPNLYSLVIENSLGSGTLYVKEKVNGIDMLVAKKSFQVKNDKWLIFSLIFQPFENEIELWLDGLFIYKLSEYTSNFVTDLNFSRIGNSTNTEMYVDELCYKEWSHSGPCIALYDPVCVNNINYGNSCWAAKDGYSINEISNGLCGFPLCTSIISPKEGDVDVSVNEVIGWDPAPNALRYFLRVGTTPNGGEIIGNLDVGNNLTYFLTNLPYNAKIYVKIQPGNNLGIKSDCQEISFTTKANIQVPTCSIITYPMNNAQNVPTTVNFSWQVASGATGYKLIIKDVNTEYFNKNVGNILFYSVGNLPKDKSLCATIVPYNIAGDAVSCSEVCFKTESGIQIPNCTPITSPANNAQNVSINTNMIWQASPGATGYKLFIKDGNTVVFYQNVGNVTSFQVLNLPKDKLLCTTVIPYNSAGDAPNCTSSCFKTETGIQLPSCTSVISPANNEQNVPTSVNLIWNPSTAATGYKIKIGTTANDSDILPLTDIGNTTNKVIENLPLNKFICATIIPYNSAGEVLNCSKTCFKTMVTSSLDETFEGQVTLFPNPASDMISISTSSQENNYGEVTIRSLDGRMIKMFNSYILGDLLDVSQLKSGVYILSIKVLNQQITKKLIIAN